jgi:hypothetical protein
VQQVKFPFFIRMFEVIPLHIFARVSGIGQALSHQFWLPFSRTLCSGLVLCYVVVPKRESVLGHLNPINRETKKSEGIWSPIGDSLSQGTSGATWRLGGGAK